MSKLTEEEFVRSVAIDRALEFHKSGIEYGVITPENIVNTARIFADFIGCSDINQNETLSSESNEPRGCPERKKSGGCQLHNLHCSYPAYENF